MALTFGGGILLDWLIHTACGEAAAEAAAVATAAEASRKGGHAGPGALGADAEEQRQAEQALSMLLESGASVHLHGTPALSLCVHQARLPFTELPTVDCALLTVEAL